MKTLFRILGTAAAVAVTGAAIVVLDKILNQKDPLHVEEVEFPEEAEKDAEEAEKTAEAYGCTAECSYFFGPAPLINGCHALNETARNAARKILGENALAPMERQMGAEDFSVYLEKTPGLYPYLGCRNEAKGLVSPHHSVTFDMDEDALPAGAALYAQFALDFLAGK